MEPAKETTLLACIAANGSGLTGRGWRTIVQGNKRGLQCRNSARQAQGERKAHGPTVLSAGRFDYSRPKEKTRTSGFYNEQQNRAARSPLLLILVVVD